MPPADRLEPIMEAILVVYRDLPDGAIREGVFGVWGELLLLRDRLRAAEKDIAHNS